MLMAETTEELRKRPEIRKELERRQVKNVKKAVKLRGAKNSGSSYTWLFLPSALLATF
jgi:hypothetical protein